MRLHHPPLKQLHIVLIGALIVGLLLSVAPQHAQADGTYQSLPFSQNWTNTGLITVNDDWSGVPGVIGYRGDTLTSSNDVDPQTVLGQESPLVVDVNANQTNPNTFTTGGVTEFHITDPVVALTGSGTADAPYIIILVNTTGFQNIAVTYNLRDIDGSVDNAAQQIALQYRLGSTGNFTNVPAGYVADATTGPGLATLVTPVNVTLPSAADNQAQLQIRIITTNASGNDEWVGIDDISITGTPIVVDTAPSVSSTTPANGATNVAVNANIDVTFSEAVDVSGSWFNITCANSGEHTAAVSGGSTTFTLDPNTDFVQGENCTVTVFAAGVKDQDSDDPPDDMAADYVFSFTTFAPPCFAADTAIGAVQGTGSAAAITGTVTLQGVVIGDYEGPSPTLRGFYIQDAGDGNPDSSDGIFVFNGNNNNVSVGQVVQVTGTAGEFQDQTQLSGTLTIENCGSTGTVTPTDVTFPVPAPVGGVAYLERFEGMLVRLPQTLYVTEHFQLGRFGQVVMSSGDRLDQPTAVVAPGAPALALQAANNLNRIIVDDDLQNQNPDPILFGRGGNPLSASNTLRGGDTATGIVGLMTYTWAGNSASGNAFRVRPVSALGGGIPNFQPANPRPATPEDVGGQIKVAGMNLLNYFNTFDGLPDMVNNCTNGVGGAATDCRGADTAAEFDRQWPKTVAAIVGTGADIIGVNEIENDGYGSTSAIQDLVNKLNAATTPGTYAFIDVDAATGQVNALGTDAIKVGLIYKPAKVTPIGITSALNTVAFVNGGDGSPRSRPSLAQAFETATGGRVVVDVNHLKSKGSPCDAPDAGDGQGNCNSVRTNAANELSAWLATDPTGIGDSDVLIIGDLNSYAKEDPVTALLNAGYTNLIDSFIGADAYSFVFDGQWGYLDYALGSASLLSQVTGVSEWHINADEPTVLDYNTNFKSAGQIISLYAPDQFRVSDHDTVLVGLTLQTTCNGLPATIVGTPGDDVLTGTAASDVIVGLGGNDTIYGLNGDDHICGNEGDDTIYGGNGADTVIGGLDNDTVFGENGDDSLQGNRGADMLDGGNGADVLDGGLDDDTLKGGLGDDNLTGGLGADSFSGGQGTDTAADFNLGEGDTQDGTIP